MNNTQTVLLELVKTGFWGNGNLDIRIEGTTDWQEVYRLATEQSVLGLVLQGIDWFKVQGSKLNIPQVLLLQWIGEVQMIEQRNKAMNQFVAELVEKMRTADIYAILVKGQGVAQCYEKPLWRPSGDVDLLLSEVNYKKAKELLLPLSSSNKNEERYSQHLGMSIGQWYVEIHGSLRTGLSAIVDKEVDAAQDSVFIGGNVRSWDNNGTLVFLPAPTEDVFLVFTHFIKHFYKEGMSLRQVCDWCRLLWTYRESLNYGNLVLWINKAGLMKEWQAFYNLANRYLGMPDLDSRLMAHNSRFDKKAEKLMEFILGGYSGNKVKDTLQIAKIFPWKALRYSPSIFLNVNWLKIRERLFK
jgi:hypothetical protein